MDICEKCDGWEEPKPCLCLLWVPVTERLPDPDDLVLVSTAKRDVCACTYCPSYDEDEPGRWTAGDWPIYDVVAWMPLPMPWVSP